MCIRDSAVTERRRLAIVRFTGTDVDDIGVAWVDGDVADRRGGVRLEDRFERDTVVFRLEHAADGVSDVDDVGVAQRHFDVVEAATHTGRSDGTEPEAREQWVGPVSYTHLTL